MACAPITSRIGRLEFGAATCSRTNIPIHGTGSSGVERICGPLTSMCHARQPAVGLRGDDAVLRLRIDGAVWYAPAAQTRDLIAGVAANFDINPGRKGVHWKTLRTSRRSRNEHL